MADTRENYSAEEALADGCVVMDGETMLAGEEVWSDFENSTAAGREAKVRIYRMYADQGGDYTVNELSYDGSTFLLQFYDSKGGDEYLLSRNYRYLVKSSYKPDTESSNLSLHYLLSDNPNVMTEGCWAHMFSYCYSPDSIYNHCMRLWMVKYSGIDKSAARPFHVRCYPLVQYLNRKTRTTHINTETCTYVRQNPLTDTNSFK